MIVNPPENSFAKVLLFKINFRNNSGRYYYCFFFKKKA